MDVATRSPPGALVNDAWPSAPLRAPSPIPWNWE